MSILNAVTLAAEEGASHNPVIPPPYDILWSFVIFVVIAVAFQRYLLPKLQKVLDERAELIEGGISKAEKAQAEAAAALEEYTAQLTEARAEAASLQTELERERRLTGQPVLASPQGYRTNHNRNNRGTL